MRLDAQNRYYAVLLVVSAAFVITALAYALVPWEQQPLWLRMHGWKLLLVEVAGIIVVGLVSMGLDRPQPAASPKDTAEAEKQR
jgi:hypothetical protein